MCVGEEIFVWIGYSSKLRARHVSEAAETYFQHETNRSFPILELLKVKTVLQVQPNLIAFNAIMVGLEGSVQWKVAVAFFERQRRRR